MDAGRRLFITIGLLLFINQTIKGQTLFEGLLLPYDPTVQSLVDMVDIDSLEAYVRRLESFGTRRILTDSSRASADWIKQKILNYGYPVAIDSFWVDSISTSGQNLHTCGYEYNIIAEKRGNNDTNIVFIVGAHYDSFNWEDTPNSIEDPYAPAPGADDNASGIACVLECARIYKSSVCQSNLKFIAFGNEEYAYTGANHYALYAKNNNINIKAVLNPDCIAFDNITPMSLYNWYGNESGFQLATINRIVGQKYAPGLVLQEPYYRVFSDTLECPDYYPFSYRGYPSIMINEKDWQYYFNNYMHSSKDTTGLLDFTFLKEVVKNHVATTAILSDYPSVVDSISIKNVGNGEDLFIKWSANEKSDVDHFVIYYGHVPGIFDSIISYGLCDTINSLISDSIYHITVRAVDQDSHPSVLAYDYQYIPKSIPESPAGLISRPVYFGTAVFWHTNTELDIAGYDIYRKINDGTYDSLTSTFDTSYVDSPLSGANRYYYKIRAYDNDGNFSQLSDSVYSRPITLDQGILVVDETNNWVTGSYPRDAQQDSFYNYILSEYKHEQHEYGSTSQKPILADFGPHSTVAWFADDYTTLLASGAMEDLKVYLDNGGKLWFTGWKATGDIRNNANYAENFAPGSFIYDYLKVSHVNLSAYTDSFQAATGLLGYPAISVDPIKVPISSWLGTMRYIESLTPVSPGEGIYAMDMKNDGSVFEGQVCAVRDSGKTVLFGFPLYFMDKDQARLAAQQIMAEFGEPSGVSTERPGDSGQQLTFKLYQNVPNPFTKFTVVSYQLPVNGQVGLRIYNITGQLIKTLVNKEQQAGSYAVKWDGRDDKNRQVSNGVYFYSLQSSTGNITNRMVLVR